MPAPDPAALAVLRAGDPAWERAGAGVPGLDVPVAQAAVRVLAALPGDARPRAELAASVAGDPHALDDHTPLAQVVTRCLAGAAGVPFPDTHRERRLLWERAGVLADAVSSTVLTLGLRPVARGARSVHLATAAALGDPVHLSLWDVRRTALGLDRDQPVLVCQAPALLEGFAERYGGAHAVVCTSGPPSALCVELLRLLGAPLACHADLDGPGLALVRWLGERCGAVPWRMTTQEYRAAPAGPPLRGPVGPAPWDPELPDALRSRGVAVPEALVRDELIEAWSRRPPPR